MFLSFLHRVAARENLSTFDAQAMMRQILAGHASTPQIAALLAALRTKGETADELTGFALAMREKMVPVNPQLHGDPLLDTCGTGGSGPQTFNISTISAIVAAAAGARVAKHGNRSMSTACGSADLLEALGVSLAQTAEEGARVIEATGIGFLFAPALHPAVRHAQPARSELRMRTVFNLLGPLANPAGAQRQVIGTPSLEAARLVAQTLHRLGTERAYVVHGDDGLDEITTTSETTVFQVDAGGVREEHWSPEDFGVRRASIGELSGGDPACNCLVAEQILAGKTGAQRDIVAVNTAAALMAAGVAQDKRDGFLRATAAIDSGAAARKLREVIEFQKLAGTATSRRA